MTRVSVYITQIWRLNIRLILVVRKFTFCFSNQNGITLSVMNIENEKYFVSKNCGASPFKTARICVKGKDNPYRGPPALQSQG